MSVGGENRFDVARFGAPVGVLAALTVVVLLFSGVAGAMAPSATSAAYRATSPPPPTSFIPEKNITVGATPEAITVDTANGHVFVANSGAKTVSVIKGTSVIATIRVGSDPVAVLYDASNTLIYVVNDLSNNVSVVNGTTDKVVATITHIDSYFGFNVYDPDNGAYYLVGPPNPPSKSNLTRLPTKSPWTPTVIDVGADAFQAVYDPATLDLVVGNPFTFSLSIVNSSTNKVTTVNLKTGQLPYYYVYNPKDKDLYIVDETTVAKPKNGNVTVLDSSNKIKTTLSISPGGISISLNPFNNYVYVVNSTILGSSRVTNSFVTPISSSNVVGTPIKAGQGAFDASYDATNHAMYVAEEYSNVTLVISSTNTVTSLTTKGSPVVAFYDPGLGYMGDFQSTKPTKDGMLTILSSPASGTPTILGNEPLGKDPYAFAYDSSNSDIYSTNENSNSVTEF
jgi:YVTN family beta-propeller protein